MHILVLLTDLCDAVGGIQTFNRALVKALGEIARDRGWKVTVFVLKDHGESVLVNRYLSKDSISYKGFAGNRLCFALAGLLASWKADQVFVGHVNFSPLICIMNKAPKYFLIVHGVEVWKRLSRLRRLGISRIDKVISVSAYTADQMARYNNLRQQSFTVFPNTVDPFYASDAIAKDRSGLGLPKGRMILSVARLDGAERQKGIDKVIETLSATLKDIPDAFYVIVGDGTDRQRLETVAKKAGVSDKVIFVGQVADKLLPSYYQNCDIFVLPSMQEGFGIVFLEAMFHAKPCIGARAGGISEVIEDGKTGFLIERDDSAHLTYSISRLLNDDFLRHAMGHAGKARWEREFSFKSFRQRLNKIF